MKSLIQSAIKNSPAMNTLMVGVLILGAVSLTALRREDFPRFELEIILVTVPYPGASPEEVENGICQKVEEAVRSIDGLKKITSVAAEGTGSVILEVRTDVPDVQKVLNEVESEVDRIPSFPELAEQPEIQQLTMRSPTIHIGVVADEVEGPEAEWQLREVVEQVRDDLLEIPEITVAEIQGARDYQIDVEISETELRKYGLTLQDVANRIRQENLELPGGNIKADSQEFLLRGKAKRIRGSEIEHIPLITNDTGVVLTVGDIGHVRDGFADKTSISRINGRPGLALSIEAAAREDMLAMTQAVRDYAQSHPLPPGYEYELWGDRSIDVHDRLDLLRRNGLQGLLLVFLVLTLFLEIRLAFWVALGIPISILGTCAILWQFDQTLNMLSMFAFLITLGIVVDDAIVIGENIYTHRQMGKTFTEAAVDGCVEVIPSVAASVTTTMFAFIPMFFVTGVMGKFFAVMPIAVLAMLAISLLESIFILPCHLAHSHQGDELPFAFRWLQWPFRYLHRLTDGVNRFFGGGLSYVIDHWYLPLLQRCLRFPAITFSVAICVFLLSVSLVTSGKVPWIIFPKMDGRQIQARVVFPNGTPSRVTDQATRQLEEAIERVNSRYAERGEPIMRLSYRLVGQVSSQSPGGASDRTEGGHAGSVEVALVETTERSVTSQQIVDEWRLEAGPIAGAETLSFGSMNMGPGGSPIEFKLLADGDDMPRLEEAVEECKTQLASYPGVYDILDDSYPGKWEFQLTIKEDARTLGVPLQALAGKVRAAYYGEEVMRLQRGRHEVKLMVRYPPSERRSLATFDDIRVDTGDGAKRPITELAEVTIERGYSEINRVDQMRSITITADVDEAQANAAQVVANLQSQFMPALLERYPEVRIRWEGQQEQSVESMQSLFIGLACALLAIFVLLTLQFTSYVQPLIIMAIIPFGMMGAIWGHAIMGIPLTMFSLFGLVALTGVVVNDSIVLVDFINHRIEAGVPLFEALMDAGRRRFRPVLLTSMTTVAGLTPILLEKSQQAQVVIPMANSLCFGLMLATSLVLFLVPTLYSIYGRFVIGSDGVRPQDVDLSPTHLDDDSSPERHDSQEPRRPARTTAPAGATGALQ